MRRVVHEDADEEVCGCGNVDSFESEDEAGFGFGAQNVLKT